MPSITFADDESGAAVSVVAADVKGNLWFLKLWESEDFCKKSPHEGKRQVQSKLILYCHQKTIFPLRQFHFQSCRLLLSDESFL